MTEPHTSGRAAVVAELIRMHGPRRAVEIVREADRKHREMYPAGCTAPICPVCSREPDADAA